MGSPVRPNILLVIADQLAAEALPSYGDPATIAPSLTGLARTGTVFERALCASPLCVPSRGSLMTGLLPSRTGAIDNAGELPASIPTFAHRLRLLGYRTVLTGKMHFVGPDQLHGFEERPMTDVYPAGLDWVPDWNCGTTSGCPGTTTSRACCAPAPCGRRCRWTTTRRWRSGLAGRSSTPPATRHARCCSWRRSRTRTTRTRCPPGCGIATPTSRSPRRATRRRRSRSILPRAACARWSTPRAARCRPSRSRPRGAGTGAITLVDEHVATLLETLDEQGLRDDTVVIVTSDHGDMLGERGLWYKMAPFEPSIRVPLIVSGAGVGQARVAGPVSLLDLCRRSWSWAAGRWGRRRPRRPQPRRRVARRSAAGAGRRARIPRGGRPVAAGDARARRR